MGAPDSDCSYVLCITQMQVINRILLPKVCYSWNRRFENACTRLVFCPGLAHIYIIYDIIYDQHYIWQDYI